MFPTTKFSVNERLNSYILVMMEEPLLSWQNNPGQETGRQGSPDQLLRSSFSELLLSNSFFISIMALTERHKRGKSDTSSKSIYFNDIIIYYEFYFMFGSPKQLTFCIFTFFLYRILNLYGINLQNFISIDHRSKLGSI